MAGTESVLKWSTLTAAINEIKSPNQFFKKTMYGNHITLPTEDIEMSLLTRGREIAPFVKKNGEGIMVGGHAEKFQTVSAPNIRLKKPFTPSELLFNRRPGTVIFSPGADMQVTALEQHIARDLQGMADMITNAEEWMIAQALTGVIAYSVTDQDIFTITFPRDSSCNITLSVFWDDATPANTRPLANFTTVKKVFSDRTGLQPTDAVFGTEAANAFRTLVETGNIKSLVSNFGQVDAAKLTFVQQYNDDGVIYMGNFAGVDCWEYGRTATLNGVAQNMVRPKYVEFFSRSGASERVLYYGAIADMKALEGRNFQGERFSKSWEVEDPSAKMCLTASRPLPVPRRPDATVSMKVVSG